MVSPLEEHSYALTPVARRSSWRFYRCTQCSYRSKFQEIMKKHRKMHNFTAYYPKYFPCARSFTRLYECKQCQFRTNIWLVYQKHLMQEKQKTKLVRFSFRRVIKHCKFCDFNTHSILVYMAHLTKCKKRRKVMHRFGWLTCSKCRFATLYNDVLIRHFQKKHTSKTASKIKHKIQHFCQKCHFQADTAINLRKHMLCSHEDSEESDTNIEETIITNEKNKVTFDNHNQMTDQGTEELGTNKDGVIKFPVGQQPQFQYIRFLVIPDPQPNKDETIPETRNEYTQVMFAIKQEPKDALEHNDNKETKPNKDGTIVGTKIEDTNVTACKSQEVPFLTPSNQATTNKDGVIQNAQMSFVIKEEPKDVMEHDEYLHSRGTEMDNVGTIGGIKTEGSIKQEDDYDETLLIPTYAVKPNSKWKFCESCEYQTIHLKELKKHIMEMHKVKETIFHCSLCTFQCTTEEERIKHVKFEHSKKIFKQFNKYTQCRKCLVNCENSRLLKLHMLHYHNDTSTLLFECEHCPYKTKLESAFICHNRLKHRLKINPEAITVKSENAGDDAAPPKGFKCTECPFETAFLVAIKNHMKFKHNIEMKKKPTIFKCPVCVFKTNIGEEKQEHMRLYHNNADDLDSDSEQIPNASTVTVKFEQNDLPKAHKCPMCPFETSFQTAITNHMKFKHNIKKKPTMCVFETTNAEEKEQHMRECHSDGKDLDEKKVYKLLRTKCRICVYDTASRDRYIRHMFNQHNVVVEKRFKCPKCKYQTDFKKAIMNHMKDEHDDEIASKEKCYKCEMCPFETGHRKGFSNHNYRMHKIRLEQKLKCNFCPFQTMRKIAFDRHVFFKHTLANTKTRVECDFCTFTPPNQSALILHLKRKHNFYRCHLCEYQAYGVDGYKEHVMTEHIDVVYVKCDLCDFETNDRLSLKDHIIENHLKIVYIYRYKCNLCVFNTTELSDFQEHTLNMHKLPERLFKCQLCCFETQDKNILKEHILGKHFGLD